MSMVLDLTQLNVTGIGTINTLDVNGAADLTQSECYWYINTRYRNWCDLLWRWI
jgi:hypothetical protein